MTSSQRKTLTIVLILLLATFLFSIRAAQQQEQRVAGLSVKIKSEHHSFGAWFVELVIPRQSYSKENLERIWQYYCEKYADLEDRLDVRVYTESAESKSDLAGARRYDAIFYRQGEGAIAGGGDNRFYTYSPDPDSPEVKQNVQLKGRYPFLTDAYTGDPSLDLVIAAGKGEIAKLEALLEQGANVDSRDDKGRTALMAACKAGQLESVRLLISRGADVNARDNEGDSVLTYGVINIDEDSSSKNDRRSRQVEIVKTLLASGADVNAQRSGWTPLLCAVSHGNNDIVAMLLSRGADLNARTDTGMTALARAIYDGRLQVFRMLLEAGADVNSRDGEGYTPLMRSARGKPAFVSALLKKGAELNALNARGETALTIAKQSPHNELIVKMLLRKGAH